MIYDKVEFISPIAVYSLGMRGSMYVKMQSQPESVALDLVCNKNAVIRLSFLSFYRRPCWVSSDGIFTQKSLLEVALNGCMYKSSV